MKTIVINADPKKSGSTAQLMKCAVKGVESVNSEVEYVDLYDFDLSGCTVCQICKNDEEICKCYLKDEVSPLIERILSSDCLLVGAPIFFSYPSSHYLALLERLIYCIVSYKTGNKFKGKVNVGFFYTTNYPKKYFEEKIRPHLKKSEDLLKMLNGDVEIHAFHKISNVERSGASEDKLKSKEEQFKNDLEKVFDICAELSK